MKTKILAFLSILILAGCATSNVLISQSDVDRVKSNYPTYTLTELTQGKTLYEEKCSTCHGLKKPTSESEAAWNEIVPDMVRKANKREVKVDPAQQELILKYLVTMCNAPAKK